MLERIEEIQGVGLFHDANGKPYRLHKAAFIYADNGRGKSTLCSLLQSLATADSAPLSRKTIDGKLEPRVSIQFDKGQKVEFSNGKWSQARPELLVFDSAFVDSNVHSGGAVTTTQRKKLLEFALGTKAVDARKKVEETTNDAKLATADEQKYLQQLAPLHAGMPAATFLALPQIDDVDAKIVELEKRLAVAGSSASLQTRALPVPVEPPSADLQRIFSGLRRSIDSVHAEADQKVRAHIESHGSPSIEGWLAAGQAFDDRTHCPYCAQETTGNDLVGAYKTFFSGAYVKQIEIANSIAGQIGALIDRNTVRSFAEKVRTAAALASPWAEHMQLPAIQFNVEAAERALSELHELLMPLAKQKEEAPTVAVVLATEEEEAYRIWNQIENEANDANNAILEAIKVIAAYREKIAKEDVLALRRQLVALMASKTRYSAPAVQLIEELKKVRARQAQAEAEKRKARDELDSEMAKVLGQYQTAINSLLLRFGASFSIQGMEANFRGSGPRTEYGLLLRGREIALEGGAPSFATALSEGDKKTLAFAFFMASAFNDPKISERIVVVDDPMSSLDRNRRHQTRAILKSIHAVAEQTIIMAHDPYFIRELRDDIRKKDSGASVSLVRLRMVGNDYSDFDKLDVDQECESPYFRRHRLLQGFCDDGVGDAAMVAEAIRPLLEGYLHRRFPGLVPDNLVFGEIVALIVAADARNPLAHAKNLVASLNDINSYAGQFHHDTGPRRAESVAIVPQEVKNFASRALTLIYSGQPS